MVLERQLILSSFIKKVHEDLRNQSKLLGTEKAWQEHCTNEEKLRKYADHMKELATNYWDKNSTKNDSKVMSRVCWTITACVEYFACKIVDIESKELNVAAKMNLSGADTFSSFNNKWKLLDVGSCYNPFGKCEFFDVVPIDIAPATNEVYKCDFLSVKTGDKFISTGSEISEFATDSFDVIVFSLLLEYLPSSRQRWLCCRKAYDLLKTQGLLIIITPDSNHIGVNAKLIKSWRFILAQMGFSRIKYEKLQHLHCMAYRKSLSKEITQRWAELHKKYQSFEEIFIPQDFKEIASLEVKRENKEGESYTNLIFINELPGNVFD